LPRINLISGKIKSKASTKKGKKKNENHSFKYEPQRTKGGFMPPFPLQITRNIPRIFSSCDLSHETLEDLILCGRGENESGERGEGDGAPSSYLTGLLHNPRFVPRYE
jgi:hypothetical protein